MPECKAKLCTVERGKGISTFLIPDPKKEYDRCARWIHNLGNTKLHIKTFKHSHSMIVCERHFEPDCFKEDLQAKLLGYTPKRKYLKDDAIPTIFADSKPKKERKTSIERLQRMEKKRLIESLLCDEAREESSNVENKRMNRATASNSEKEITNNDLSHLQKSKRKQTKPLHKTSKKTKTLPSSKEIGIQVSPSYTDKSVGCNIQLETQDRFCTKCFERNYPSLTVRDHSYVSKKIQPTSALTVKVEDPDESEHLDSSTIGSGSALSANSR